MTRLSLNSELKVVPGINHRNLNFFSQWGGLFLSPIPCVLHPSYKILGGGGGVGPLKGYTAGEYFLFCYLTPFFKVTK